MAASDKPSLLALSARRQQAIDLLTTRFAEGVLDIEEFESRVGRAHEAQSVATVEALVEDLQPAQPDHSLAVRPQTGSALAVTPQKKRKSLMAFMGGVERTGRWTVPAAMSVTAVMGGVALDFREATLQPGVTDVKVRAIMGGVDIIVPPDVAVEADGIAIMGGFEDQQELWPDTSIDRPVLRITGVAVMGAVEIKTREPGESGRAARRRRRSQRKQLATARKANRRRALPNARKQLPPGAHTDE